jgi:hypothetical protein
VFDTLTSHGSQLAVAVGSVDVAVQVGRRSHPLSAWLLRA